MQELGAALLAGAWGLACAGVCAPHWCSSGPSLLPPCATACWHARQLQGGVDVLPVPAGHSANQGQPPTPAHIVHRA